MTMGYIEDRIAKLEGIVNSLVEADGNTANALQDIWKEIFKLRKAEKYGEWKKLDVAEYRCMNCGKIQYADDVNELNYCCNCGSRNKVAE